MYFYYLTHLQTVWKNICEMIQENYDECDNHNTAVVLGSYIYAKKENLIPNLPSNINKVVVYQTEPLVKQHFHPPEQIIENLRSYDEVWEFDYDNYLLLLNQGINAHFKPVKYTHSLKKIQNVSEPDIDILFYGSYTHHRHQYIKNYIDGYVYKDIKQYQLSQKRNIVWLYGLDDNRLDEFISRSKIILNLQPHKQDENEDRQSQVRIFYPLINGKCIVSERSMRNYFGNCIIEIENSQELGDVTLNLLETGEWRNYPYICSDYERFVNREILIEGANLG